MKRKVTSIERQTHLKSKAQLVSLRGDLVLCSLTRRERKETNDGGLFLSLAILLNSHTRKMHSIGMKLSGFLVQKDHGRGMQLPSSDEQYLGKQQMTARDATLQQTVKNWRLIK